MNSSRRARSRKQPATYLEIYDRQTDNFVGTVVDFTVSGLRLYTENPLEPGHTYQWRLILHEPIQDHAQIVFDATCRWCKECSGKLLAGSFAAGLELTAIDQENRSLVEAMLDSAWFRDWRQLPDYEAIRRETGFPVD